MKKYIAELTSTGIYNLVIVEKEISSTYYLLDHKKVSDRVIVDSNGKERLFSHRNMSYVEFDSIEECNEFIERMNSL